MLNFILSSSWFLNIGFVDFRKRLDTTELSKKFSQSQNLCFSIEGFNLTKKISLWRRSQIFFFNVKLQCVISENLYFYLL